MFLHVVEAKYIDNYKIEILFSDGHRGVADLEGSFRGKAFKALRDLEIFSRFTVDDEIETIVWPNGTDFAPEFLYFKAFGDVPELQAQFRAWGYKTEQAA